MIVVGFRVGVVVAMDEPDVGLPKDGLKPDVQRSPCLQVLQQHDGSRAMCLDGFEDVGKLAVWVAAKQNHGCSSLRPVKHRTSRKPPAVKSVALDRSRRRERQREVRHFFLLARRSRLFQMFPDSSRLGLVSEVFAKLTLLSLFSLPGFAFFAAIDRQ